MLMQASEREKFDKELNRIDSIQAFSCGDAIMRVSVFLRQHLLQDSVDRVSTGVKAR